VAEAQPPAGQALAGPRLPEHGEGAIGAVDADAVQAEGVGAGVVSSLLGGEGRRVARLARIATDRLVVVAVRVGEDRRRRGQPFTQFGERAGELLTALVLPELGQATVVAGVRTDRDAGIGERAQLLPGRDRLSVDPVRACAQLRRRHEKLWAPAGVTAQGLDAVDDRVVDRDRDAAAGQLCDLTGVEGENRRGVEGSEPAQPQRPQLTGEATRRDVDPLLTRLQLAGEAVVDEDRIGAAGGATRRLGVCLAHLDSPPMTSPGTRRRR
jgi:hypothetical protein